MNYYLHDACKMAGKLQSTFNKNSEVFANHSLILLIDFTQGALDGTKRQDSGTLLVLFVFCLCR